MSDQHSHWWHVDARRTACGLQTVGRVLSPSPSCLDCQRQLQTDAELLAALESKTPRDYRLELAASALAPTLRLCCLKVDNEPMTPWADLIGSQREAWLLYAESIIKVLTAHLSQPQPLEEFVETWKATTLRLVKGGQS